MSRLRLPPLLLLLLLLLALGLSVSRAQAPGGQDPGDAEDPELAAFAEQEFCAGESLEFCEGYLNEIQAMLESTTSMVEADPSLVAAGAPTPVFAENSGMSLQVVVDEFGGMMSRIEEASILAEPILNKDVLPASFTVAETFQRVFFNWHCKRFHAFHEALFDAELAYVDRFFSLYGTEHYNFYFGHFVGNRMSSYTYSHRSKPAKGGGDERGKARINSSRFACGTTSQEAALFPAAEPVLRARGIDLDPHFAAHPESFAFYGLGWDIGKQYFKVYVMFHQVSNLPHRYLKLVSDVLAESKMPAVDKIKWAPFGLISFTYVPADKDAAGGKDCGGDGTAEDGGGDGTCKWRHLSKLHEEKVYLYPDEEVHVPDQPKPSGTAGKWR